MLIGKGHRTRQRRVNGKAGVGLSLPHTRRGGNKLRSVGTPNCVIRPEGNSMGWSVMSAEFQAMGKLCYEPEKGL